jgi:putative SOS response-associated peptidase YedK
VLTLPFCLAVESFQATGILTTDPDEFVKPLHDRMR